MGHSVLKLTQKSHLKRNCNLRAKRAKFVSNRRNSNFRAIFLTVGVFNSRLLPELAPFHDQNTDDFAR